jgi:hypothetical protein
MYVVKINIMCERYEDGVKCGRGLECRVAPVLNVRHARQSTVVGAAGAHEGGGIKERGGSTKYPEVHPTSPCRLLLEF